MNGSWPSGLLALSLSMLLGGCASFTPKDEYRAYREVRLSTDLATRLRATASYVSRFPHGRWTIELEEARAAEEAQVFESLKDTRDGLSTYLEVFPQGVFARQAVARMQAIDLIERQRAEEARRAAQASEDRLARAREARRTWVGRFARYWIGVLGGLSGWGKPIPEVAQQNPDFSQAFGRAPRPRCTKQECVKYYTANYAIPIPGATRLERTIQLILRLHMDPRDGSLVRAELLIPGWGFSRWSEVEQRRLVIDSDPGERKAAVAWALEQLTPAVAALAAGELVAEPDYVLAAIARPAVGPTGERTDTSAKDPSQPGDALQEGGSAPVGQERSVSDLLAGDGGKAGAGTDMVVDTIVVDEPSTVSDQTSGAAPQGRPPGRGPTVLDDDLSLDAEDFRRAAGEETEPTDSPPAPKGTADGSSGEVMLDAIAVPGADGSKRPGEAVITELPQAIETPMEPVTVAYRVGKLRVVLFAAGGTAPAPAYDGVLIERADGVAPR